MPLSTFNAYLVSEDGEEIAGGTSNTVFDQSENAFGFVSPGLSGNDELLFFVGNSFFNQNWVSAPASTTARDGLGPTFNSRSCSGCHFKDGKGKPPDLDNEVTSGFLIRLSVPGMDENGGPLPDPNYGGQLQDKAIQGVPVEGAFDIQYIEIPGKFDDGEAYSLQYPVYTFKNLSFGPLDPSIMISPRIGQQMIGLGLLEALDEAVILQYADEADADNDGISGKPNYVWDHELNQVRLGRFGWKANQPSLSQQTAGAFLGDLGITTPIFGSNNCPGTQQACLDAPNGGEPEIELDDFNKVVLYVSNLAVPARRNVNDSMVLEGKRVFNDIGCVKCHVSKLETGTHDVFPHLSNQVIWPYTDMLLHDMGDALADGRPDYLANGNEWRTPPLWGVGLIEKVNGHTFFLHDGRARNLNEAILWHGGEAENVKGRYLELSKAEREAVLKFLESL